MNTQIYALTLRAEDLALAARNAVSRKNRASALSALRSKKATESTLLRRSEVLAQLEEVYSKIEQAADQVEILRVMSASAGILKRLNADTGGVEKVEDVVEELRDEMGKVDEVGNALTAVGQAGVMIDEAEVDIELDAMEREQGLEAERVEATEMRRRLDELPKMKVLHSPEDIESSEVVQTASGQTGLRESSTI